MQTDAVDQQNTAVTPKDGLETALPNLASQSHLLHPNVGSNESDAITHLHYTATVTGWRLVEVVPHLSPTVSWDRLQHPGNPEPNKQFKKIDGSMQWITLQFKLPNQENQNDPFSCGHASEKG